jgi:hypothetical protein
MNDGRKQTAKNLKKIRTKLWDIMYVERQNITDEYELLDSACILITEAVQKLSNNSNNGGEGNGKGHE